MSLAVGGTPSGVPPDTNKSLRYTNMKLLDLAIILIYLVSMLFVGIYANRKQKSMEDYYVAGRQSGAFPIMCLWMSAWIGGASITGTASKAYDMGITAVWYVLIIVIGMILFAVIMTKPVKRISDRMQSITFPDFIESRYDSKTRLATTVTTIIAYIAYSASQFVAGAAILHALVGWPMWVCFVATTAVIVLYTSIGGFLAVIYTDMAQMLLLVLGIVCLAVPISINLMLKDGLSFSALPENFFDLGAWGWPTIIALGVSTVFSFFTSMDSYTKVFSARDEHTAYKGMMLAAATGIVIALASTFLGLFSRLALPNLASSSGCLASLIMEKFPTGVKGIVLVAILSAIMSTGDVSVLTASSNITRDIYQRYINPAASDKRLMRLSIISSVLIGAVSALFAWYKQDIVDVLFIAFTINSAGLFLPTVCGLFWKRSNSAAACTSIVSALVISVIWFAGSALTDWAVFRIDALWPAFIVSAVLFLIITLTGKQSEAELEKAEIFYAAK